MQPELAARIQADPRFQELVSKRSRYNWTMAIIMMAIYYVFILFIAFNPTALGAKLGEGTVLSVGILTGFLIIISAFVLTGIYVRRANSEFDALTAQIKENAK
ncbi:MAG TPA: DUF485 domain-containing protein [Chromatiales bacterium]|nr:DUF485 domain-containing protein [Chromatiales bacterium]